VKRLFESFLLWGLRPGANAKEMRHHRYLTHGILYGWVMGFSGIVIVEFFIQYFYRYEQLNLFHYRLPLYLNFSAFFILSGILHALRAIDRWRSFWNGAICVVMLLVQGSSALMLGLESNFLLLQASLSTLPYLVLFSRPISASILAFFNLMLAAGVYLYLLHHPPICPTPPLVNRIVGPTLIGLSCVLFILQILYLALLSDLFPLVQRVWLKLSHTGAEKFLNETERRSNIISNQVILSFVLIMVVVVGALIVLSATLIFDAADRYYTFPLATVLPSLVLTGVLVWIFRAKNTIGYVNLFEFLAYGLGIVFVFCESILQPLDVGIHFTLLPIALVPAFFSQAGWIPRFLAGIVAIGLFFLRPHVLAGGVFSLPQYILDPLRAIIATTNVLIMAVIALYLWLKNRLTQRFIALWVNWSDSGVELFDTQVGKKYRKIQNQIVLIFAGAVGILIIYECRILYELVKVKHPQTLQFFLHYGILVFVQQAVQFFCIWYNRRSRSLLGYSVAFFGGASVVTFLAISVQKETYFFLMLISLLPVPYLSFSGKSRGEKIFIVIGTLVLILMTTFSHWFLSHYRPLMPLPFPAIVVEAGYVALTAITVLYVIIFYYSWRQIARTEKILELEMEKSNNLLLNILPAHVAEELKEKGHAKPISFQAATVMFTDFVGFTSIAEKLSPEDLVGELDKCFSYFDSVCVKYNLEKLKTIGDSFMAAGGVPVPNHTHAIDCCLAALEVQAFMNQMREIKAAQGHPYWELRLGINTGNLVAGVVGEKKFAYDVWGDTVNTASRMESSGTPGQINISRSTYELVKFLFKCTFRGRVKAKNKGEVEMYYLEGIRPRYSLAGEGRVPNADFRSLYERIRGGARLIGKKSRS